jgi:hypothetical protein
VHHGHRCGSSTAKRTNWTLSTPHAKSNQSKYSRRAPQLRHPNGQMYELQIIQSSPSAPVHDTSRNLRMSASPSLVIRRTIGPSTSLLRTQSQRRYARVHDVRFVTTHRDSERILEKYRDKLEQKAKQYILPHLLPL